MSTVNFLVVSDVGGNGLYQSSIVDRQAKCEWSWPWWMTVIQWALAHSTITALLCFLKEKHRFLEINQCYWNAAYCCRMTLIDMNVNACLVLILTDWSCAWQGDHVLGRVIMWLAGWSCGCTLKRKVNEWGECLTWIKGPGEISFIYTDLLSLNSSSLAHLYVTTVSHPSRWNKNK